MGPTGFTQTIHMPNGQEITLNTGRYAKQADGSVVLRCGDTVILATVCSATEVAPETDFFPLSVDYREKYYATGKFPGGFFKREAKPSDYEARLYSSAAKTAVMILVVLAIPRRTEAFFSNINSPATAS